VAALGAIGDPAGLRAILVGCADKPAVRRRAVLALAPFEGPEVDAALQRALTDRDWQVRQAAEDLLAP
jgi:HEAT repeat protein